MTRPKEPERDPSPFEVREEQQAILDAWEHLSLDAKVSALQAEHERRQGIALAAVKLEEQLLPPPPKRPPLTSVLTPREVVTVGLMTLGIELVLWALWMVLQ